MRQKKKRSGAAAVEFAMVSPFLFLMVWGCIELTRYNLMKNVTYHAAFESARIGVKPGATAEDIIEEALFQMKYVCDECTVIVTPSEIDMNTDEITVAVQVDIRQQGLVAIQYFDNPILEASFTIRRDNVSPF
ncbi:MAG: pilus assembly protein [Pirellulaceae bacterium]|nr:pilus assembly protein [Pirellulaceae bacterium]